METRGLFAHVLPQAVLDRPREGMVPDITAPTRVGQPAAAADAPPPPRRNVMMDVKTLSGAAELYREGPHARSTRRGAPVAERARRVHGDYVRRARELDHQHSRQADGSPYPGVREQGRRHLVGPVLAALRAWDPVVGLVVGSYQGCSEELHALAREVAEERARTEWRQMGARSEHEALGIFVHDVHRRWGSVFWRSWARVIRGRLPAIGMPNADILNHGPPPAYARGQAVVGGADQGRARAAQAAPVPWATASPMAQYHEPAGTDEQPARRFTVHGTRTPPERHHWVAQGRSDGTTSAEVGASPARARAVGMS